MSAYPTRQVVQTLADEITQGRLNVATAVDEALRRGDADGDCGLLLAACPVDISDPERSPVPSAKWAAPTS